MTALPLYPLRFEPIHEYRPWGGRRLADLIAEPLPAQGPVGEAWVLSDRDDYPSRVSNGPLTGRSLHQLLLQFPEQMMGDLAGRFARFPLLLKFLDVQTALSVQVHPSQQQAAYLPAGETAKTEAWFVLRTGENSRVHAGLKPDATATTLRQAIAVGELPDQLASFTPEPGDTVFIPAGTVHALADVIVFEVQQNSDVTYRLYDWDNTDANTGQPRALQIDQALACTNFEQGPVHPITPLIEPGARRSRKRLLSSRQFCLSQTGGESPCAVGVAGRPQVLICTEGTGHLDHQGASYDIRAGQVWLLPAQVGAAMFRPTANATLLEVEIPDSALADNSTTTR
jgi:mannose-6-phosphate isomerase